MDEKEIKQWIEENIVRSTDGHLITGQSQEGFKQSVRRGFIKPYIKLNRNPDSNKATHLYLKEDLEQYSTQLAKRNNEEK